MMAMQISNIILSPLFLPPPAKCAVFILTTITEIPSGLSLLDDLFTEALSAYLLKYQVHLGQIYDLTI